MTTEGYEYLLIELCSRFSLRVGKQENIHCSLEITPDRNNAIPIQKTILNCLILCDNGPVYDGSGDR